MFRGPRSGYKSRIIEVKEFRHLRKRLWTRELLSQADANTIKKDIGKHTRTLQYSVTSTFQPRSYTHNTTQTSSMPVATTNTHQSTNVAVYCVRSIPSKKSCHYRVCHQLPRVLTRVFDRFASNPMATIFMCTLDIDRLPLRHPVAGNLQACIQ